MSVRGRRDELRAPPEGQQNNNSSKLRGGGGGTFVYERGERSKRDGKAPPNTHTHTQERYTI